MKIKGFVSIGLPVYNRAQFLPRIFDVLLSQTYRHIEVIVSDNASDDETERICKEYALRDPRVRYIRQEENMGQLHNFRFVLEEARGEYFMWAYDDDWWAPTYVETMKKALDARPDYGVAMSSYRRVYNDGVLMDEFYFIGKYDITRLGYYDVFKLALLPGPKVSYFLSFGLFRTALLKSIMRRPHPDCIKFDHVIAAEAALSTHFYSAPDILFSKTMYRKSIKERYKDDPEVGKAYGGGKRTRHIRYARIVFDRILRSPVIPVTRKFGFLMYAYPRFLKHIIPFVIIFDFPEVYSLAKRIVQRK